MDELKPETPSLRNLLEDEKKPNYPENYKSCVNVFQLLKNAFQVGMSVNTF